MRFKEAHERAVEAAFAAWWELDSGDELVLMRCAITAYLAAMESGGYRLTKMGSFGPIPTLAERLRDAYKGEGE